MKQLLLVGLIALTAGCVTKSTMTKALKDQEVACNGTMQFNLAVQESMIVEQCNTVLDRQTRAWEDLFCSHDRDMANKLAKETGTPPKYFKPCLQILKERTKAQAPAPAPVAPARDYNSGKR